MRDSFSISRLYRLRSPMIDLTSALFVGGLALRSAFVCIWSISRRPDLLIGPRFSTVSLKEQQLKLHSHPGIAEGVKDCVDVTYVALQRIRVDGGVV